MRELLKGFRQAAERGRNRILASPPLRRAAYTLSGIKQLACAVVQRIHR